MENRVNSDIPPFFSIPCASFSINGVMDNKEIGV